MVCNGFEFELGCGDKIKLSPGNRITSVRADQYDRLMKMIRGHFSGYRVLQSLGGTDRLRYQSAAFLRVILENKNEAVAVLAAYEDEPVESKNRFLVALVMWWDRLASSREIRRIVGMVPQRWERAISQDLAVMNVPASFLWFRLADLEVQPVEHRIEWSSVGSPYVIFPKTETPSSLAILRSKNRELDLIYRKDRWELSYYGLPIAWEGDGSRNEFDIRVSESLSPDRFELFQCHLEEVKKYRSFPPPDPQHPLYRFGRERWYESLLIRNQRLLNPLLTGEVYCQVPTWVGGERKVLDLLSVTGDGRLVVVELKPQKDMSLVFQGLEYWNRVVHHLGNRDFERAGYFRKHQLVDKPPLLYLVSPLFEFHRLLPILQRYLDPSISFECVGTNQDWRDDLRLLRRFQLRFGT
jgi:hypothetical protein